MKSPRTHKPNNLIQKPSSDSESAGGVSKMPVQRNTPVETDPESPEKFNSTALNMRADMPQQAPVLQGFFSSYFEKLGWGGAGAGASKISSGNAKGTSDYGKGGAGGSTIDTSTYKITDSNTGKNSFPNDYKESVPDHSKSNTSYPNKEEGIMKL